MIFRCFFMFSMTCHNCLLTSHTSAPLAISWGRRSRRRRPPGCPRACVGSTYAPADPQTHFLETRNFQKSRFFKNFMIFQDFHGFSRMAPGAVQVHPGDPTGSVSPLGVTGGSSDRPKDFIYAKNHKRQPMNHPGITQERWGRSEESRGDFHKNTFWAQKWPFLSFL